MNHTSRFRVPILAGLLGAAVLSVGAQAATYSPREQANMKLVADLYAAIEQHGPGGLVGSLTRYSREDYIQHSLGPRDTLRCVQGQDGLMRCSQKSPPDLPTPATARAPVAPPKSSAKSDGRAPSVQKVLALAAVGDLVIRVSSRSIPAPTGKGASTTYIFNMFRIQDGKLAEHWDGFSGMGTVVRASARSPTAKSP